MKVCICKLCKRKRINVGFGVCRECAEKIKVQRRIERIETVLERDQLIQRFILEHDKDLPTAQMVTLLAKRINNFIEKEIIK